MKTPITDSLGMIGSPVIHHPLGVRKALLVCGIVASLIWLGTDVLAALSYEGYRYPFDPISGLTAIDAPTRPFVVLLDILYALFKITFALGVWASAGQLRALRITAALLLAFGLIDLIANFFPWNPAESVGTFANLIHGILTGALPIPLIVLAIGIGANADGRWFRFYSYGTLLVMILMGVSPLLGGFHIADNQPPEWFGAVERVNGYGFMLWMMALAIILLRHRTGKLAG